MKKVDLQLVSEQIKKDLNRREAQEELLIKKIHNFEVEHYKKVHNIVEQDLEKE